MIDSKYVHRVPRTERHEMHSSRVLNQKLSAAVHHQQYDPLMEVLTFLQQQKIRRPDLVLDYGQHVMTHYPRRLADRMWSVCEQVLFAALDLHQHDVATRCLDRLASKFSPTSVRVRRLEGMIYEAQGKYRLAREIYADLLKENPANMLVMKREIAILRAQGQISEAIVKCNDLLATFPVDASSWQELAELHCGLARYASAAFCYEELILVHPLESMYHLKLAELYVTMGALDDVRAARKHYCQSLELQRSGNTRALVGLVACTRAFSSLVASFGSSKTAASKVTPEELALNQRVGKESLSQMHLTYAVEASTDLATLTQQVWTEVSIFA